MCKCVNKNEYITLNFCGLFNWFFFMSLIIKVGYKKNLLPHQLDIKKKTFLPIKMNGLS